MLTLAFVAVFVVGFIVGITLSKEHPLLEAKTAAEVHKAWAECCQLYLDAKRRVGVK